MADELAADIVSAKSDYAAEQKAAAEQAAAEEKSGQGSGCETEGSGRKSCPGGS